MSFIVNKRRAAIENFDLRCEPVERRRRFRKSWSLIKCQIIRLIIVTENLYRVRINSPLNKIGRGEVMEKL